MHDTCWRLTCDAGFRSERALVIAFEPQYPEFAGFQNRPMRVAQAHERSPLLQGQSQQFKRCTAQRGAVAHNHECALNALGVCRNRSSDACCEFGARFAAPNANSVTAAPGLE